MTVHRRDVNLPGPAQRPLYFFAEIIADYLALTVKFAIFFQYPKNYRLYCVFLTNRIILIQVVNREN